MNKKLYAYSTVELEKREILLEAKKLYTSNIITKPQWLQIKSEYNSALYTPAIPMKILFFITTLLAMSTILGLLSVIFHLDGFVGYQIMSFILGVILIIIAEQIFIKDKKHYKSGTTEAAIYVGMSFIAFGLLAGEPKEMLLYPLVGLILSAFATLRYLNLVALLASLFFASWILFEMIFDIGGIAITLMPIIFMLFLCSFVLV